MVAEAGLDLLFLPSQKKIKVLLPYRRFGLSSHMYSSFAGKPIESQQKMTGGL